METFIVHDLKAYDTNPLLQHRFSVVKCKAHRCCRYEDLAVRLAMDTGFYTKVNSLLQQKNPKP